MLRGCSPDRRSSGSTTRIHDGARINDVRTPEVSDTGYVEGALNLDIQNDDFVDELDDLDRGFVVYCRPAPGPPRPRPRPTTCSTWA